MIFVYAFLVLGIVCAIGQFIQDYFKLTAGHIIVLFVVIGTFLDFGGFYDRLVDFAGAGALLPITSFGHSLVHASLEGARESGFLGLTTGMFSITSAGIVWSILLAFIIGMFFKPKS